jgi:hypothetical protein
MIKSLKDILFESLFDNDNIDKITKDINKSNARFYLYAKFVVDTEGSDAVMMGNLTPKQYAKYLYDTLNRDYTIDQITDKIKELSENDVKRKEELIKEIEHSNPSNKKWIKGRRYNYYSFLYYNPGYFQSKVNKWQNNKVFNYYIDKLRKTLSNCETN